MKFDLCIPHVSWPPTASFKGVEPFDHILRRGRVFFEPQRGKKRLDEGKNNASSRWHIQIKIELILRILKHINFVLERKLDYRFSGSTED